MADMYGDENYWDNRYSTSKEFFDWFHRYSGLKEYLAPLVTKEDLILNIGCGVSRMAEEMFDDGFERVVSIDFAQNAVKMMSEKCRHKRDEFYYQKMDLRNLEFENGMFDCAIDKGTLDCLFVIFSFLSILVR
jgi:ubiquinone/menaquinone biosynthesis C-methylase UbiE